MYTANADVLKYLVEAGANLNTKDKEDGTLLHTAAACTSNLDVLKYLIAQGMDVNAKDKNGQTPFHNCVECNVDLNVWKYLIDHVSDVNAKDKNGKTPMDIFEPDEEWVLESGHGDFNAFMDKVQTIIGEAGGKT